VKPFEASMHPLKPEFDLPKLRRQLEEILAMVKAAPNGAASLQGADETVRPGRQYDVSDAEQDVALSDECPESATVCEPALLDQDQPDERGDLYDDALVVVTEFGQASPAVLQMWLSIDYASAITILNRFQADGLVSPKGRVRHKAYSLRRSEAWLEGRDGRFRD
jgi:DNA segregation ATPase FtsK/SpoIIIE-like protein